MTPQEIEKEFKELSELGSAISQVLLTIIHRINWRNESLGKDIIDHLELILPVQEGAGKKWLQELIEALKQLGSNPLK